MNDEEKSKGQLIKELEELRKQIVQLKEAETKAQLAEEALRLSEQQLRSYVDSAGDAIYVIDLKSGRIMNCNQQARLDLGYTQNELLELYAKDIEVHFNPDEIESVHGQIIPGKTMLIEGIHKRKDGSTFPVEIRFSLLDSAESQHGIAIVRDITERKEAEEVIQKNLRFRQVLMDAIPSPIFYKDAKGIYLGGNKAFERYLGQPLDQIIGKTVYDLSPPDLAEIYERADRELLNNPGQQTYETSVASSEGIRRNVIFNKATFTNDEGKVAGLIGVIVDITERKQAEEERKAHLRFLESLERVDQAIKQEVNVEKMLWNIVKTVFSIFDCDRAWLFYPCDPEAPSFRVPVEIYRPEYPGANLQDLDVPMSPDLAENLRELLESEDPVTYTAGTDRPINQVTAEQFGVQSQMTVPIYPKLGKPWVFGMHQCSYPRIWTNEEKKLFKEISRRISDGLSSALFFREQQENEERFRATFEQAAVGIAHVAPDGRWMLVNRKLCDIVGYSREELLQKTFQDITHPDDLDAYLENVRQMLAGEIQTCSKEKRYIRKDGSIIWIDLTVSIVHQASGEPKYFIAVIEGITKRKRAEEALQQSEDKFKLAFQTSPDAINITRLEDGLYVDVNQGFTDQTGFTREEVIGRTSLEINIWQDLADRERLVQGLQTRGFYENLEAQFRRKDGSIKTGLLSARVIRLGEVPHVLSITRDISERKQAEERLKESEDRYRTVADFTYDWEEWITEEGKYLYVSPSCERVTGYRAQEFIDNPSLFFDILHPDDRQIVKTHYYDEHYNPDVGHLDFRILTKTGEERWISHYCQPVFDSQGRWSGRRASNRDFTDKKRLEGQLRLAQRMESIGTLAGGIAHDFNNILTPILMGAELTQLTIPEESPAQDHLQAVVQATHRAKELVRQILVFSRQGDEEKRPFRLIPEVKEVIKLIRASLPSTIEIVQHIDAVSDIIISDSIQIHQILMNLCTNAAHAMREKGGILEIGLTNQSLEPSDLTRYEGLNPGDFIKLTIQDTGHGMDGRTMEKIFDPFFTTKERGEGTGMGLSVVHGIVKSLKGAITVDSEPHKGTTFSVYIPCLKEEIIKEPERSKQTPRGTERILFVDDETSIGNLYKIMLERLGYQVDTRNDALEAWNDFRENPDKFDLVITDQTMPKMTGIELAETILRLSPDLPIILCTGFSQQDVAESAKKVGIEEILFKPIAGPELSQLIRKIFDRKAHKKPTPIA